VNDDKAPGALAAYIGTNHVNTRLHLVGGNIDFDGLGSCFATQVLVDENALYGLSSQRFLQSMQATLGVTQMIVMPNYETLGIQHIDCALKVLDEETLLITRVPATHPSYPYREAIAQAAAQLQTPYGRSYAIVRVDAPVWKGGSSGQVANYANSLIVNDKVFVPLFGMHPEDELALQAYRDAMPGYEVFGYEMVSGGYPMGSWASNDALHCRTHQVYDPNMLLIKHPRVRSASAGVAIQLSALIRPYSGAPLDLRGTGVTWRQRGSGAWSFSPFAPGSKAFEYTATLPAQATGVTIEYFVRAATSTGQLETRPPSQAALPSGFIEFSVQ
jgi:hypothetical protein